jgi:PBSX family phage terminase large subunit
MNLNLSLYESRTMPVYQFLCWNFKYHEFLWGSRLSGKTFHVIEKTFAFMCLFPGMQVIIFRHEKDKIRDSTYKDYRLAIDRLGLRSLVKTENNNEIKLLNGSRISYFGMKGNTASVKGLHFHLGIYEESEQSERKDFTALETNLRDGQTGILKSACGRFSWENHLIFILNPPEYQDHYIVKMFDDAEKNPEEYKSFVFLKTTIDDNIHATQKDYERLERIRVFDEHDYQRYRFGLCLPRSQGLFFKEGHHFDFITEDEYKEAIALTEFEKEVLEGKIKVDPEQKFNIEQKKKRIDYQIKLYGHDFSEGTGGDPETILEGYVNFVEKTLYVRDLVFDNTLETIEQEVEAMEESGVDKKHFIFADSSRKRTIKTLKEKGFNIYEVDSTNPNILETIKLLKQFKIYICASTVFKPKRINVKQQVKQLPLKQQIPLYSRKYDSKKECFLEDPETDKKNMGIDFWDSLRYMVYGYVKKFNKRLD